MSFEQDLRRALKRKEPPAGFVERVLAGIADGGTRHHGRGAARRRSRLRWVAAAAAALLLAGGSAHYRTQQQVRRDAAKADVIAALGIASEKLQVVRHLVQRHN